MAVDRDEATEIIYYGLIMQELRKYDRFNAFVDMNYQVQTKPNPDEGRIDVIVIEEDAEHVRQRIAEAAKEAMEGDSGIEIAPANALEKLKQ